MTVLTASQIAQVAREGGFPESAIPTAVAVALAESSGDTNAHNTNRLTGDNSYGLWQINMLDKMGPERRKAFGLSSNNELFNPITNARAANRMSNGGKNWGPWSTYPAKAALYMPKARAAAGTKGTATQAGWWDDFKKGFSDGFDVGPGPEDLWDGGTENDPSLGEGLGNAWDRDMQRLQSSGVWSVGTLLTGLATALTNPDNWRNWAFVGIGGALVIAGLVVVTKPYAAPLANALPTGRVVSAVKGMGKKG